MKKILLPTDFSDNSWNAITYALQLFKDTECNFCLLNTYTPIIYHYEQMYTSSAEFGLLDAVKQASQNGLDTFKEKIEKEFSNPKHIISTISAFNTLFGEIDELHEGNAIDFIIMGTQGATGAKEILFGSNTVQMFKNAKCPVLAVPSSFTFEKPHDILFPSDYEIDFQEKHIQLIRSIASLYNARVNILNVSYGYDLSENQMNNQKKLGRLFKGVTHLFHSVRNESVPEAITKFQMKTKINLLVMINNKHSFFENLFFKSNINQIGFHLNVPFLVIPSKV